MSSIDTTEQSGPAKEARDTLFASRSLRVLARPAPEFHPDNPLLPVTTDDPNRQLPARFQGQTLKVSIPKFDIDGVAGQRVVVRLIWDGALLGNNTWRFTLPIEDSEFPGMIALSPNQTTQPGLHSLQYQVNVEGNPAASDALDFNIDRTAPNNGGPGSLVTLPAEVESNGITKEYLDANGGVLITVPGDYADRKIGDAVNVYFGRSIPSAVYVGKITRTDTTSPLTTTLTAAQIGLEEGEKSIFYTLEDRVGNVGRPSEYKPVDVVLTPAPAGLRPLTIPLAPPGDDLIDPQDVVTGVEVVIEPYTNFVSGDIVEVDWGGIKVTAIAVEGSQTFVRIPYPALLEGGTSGTGPKPVDVTYAIKRARTYPEGTVVGIQVDLRSPGPENPDIPDPVNPLLEKVTVRGAVSAVDNMLTEDDAGQDATATVEIYEPHVAGEIVQLYWNFVPVPAPGGVYEVVGDEAEAQLIPFTIPWDIIEAAGNNSALPVRYSITHPDVNNAEVFSPDQPVEVAVTVVALPAVKFLNLDEDFGNLNCNSLREKSGIGWGVEIQVEGGEPQLANQVLTFNYTGHNTAENREVTFSFTYEPTPQEATAGFIVFLEYEPLRDTRNGPGTIEYTAVVDGFTRKSPKDTVPVWMGIAGAPGATCELNRSGSS
ncbi:MAG: hypothetical protein ACRER8_07950 [Pseudomonas sp.]|uniref:hypothetical protein n=1 Tax=Pseudomonas sp. TaxID=306 RepID=UPI003D6F81D1